MNLLLFFLMMTKTDVFNCVVLYGAYYFLIVEQYLNKIDVLIRSSFKLKRIFLYSIVKINIT